MEPLSVKLNHIEYRLLTVDLQARGHSQEAVANTAIALTLKSLNKKQLVPTDRRDESILKQYAKHRLPNKKPEWEWLAFKQIVPQITADNYIALQDIMQHYKYRTKTDAFSFCLRTLAKYVEALGYNILDKYKSPSREDKVRVVKIPIKIKLAQLAMAQVMTKAHKQGLKPEEWIEKLVYDNLPEQ